MDDIRRNIHAEANAIIDAPPERVYAVIADYHEGHQAILPRPTFQAMVVEKGGTGAGTEVRLTMRVMGDVRTFRQVVSEPEPGRVLVETNEDGRTVTTFTVDPLDEGQRARVTIATDFAGRPGLAGFFERLVSPRFLRSLYEKELALLADYVRGGGGGFG